MNLKCGRRWWLFINCPRKREEWKDEGEQNGVHKVARNLLRQGMTVELVAQATELTIEQIEQLRDRP
jgi:predicted transposase YdaD